MASARAYRLCPHAVFLRPNFEKYRAASEEIRKIFRAYTERVEPLSLDEAYLDVTNNSMGLYATQIAKRICEEIREKTALSASAGVGPNKMIAKIASDYRKPGGITVVLPEQVETFMASLAIRKIPGVGPATEKKLKALGFEVCRDLWEISDENKGKLGERMSSWLMRRSRGLDSREVETSRIRKSVGREDTFEIDLLEMERIRAEVAKLSEYVAEYLGRRKIKGRTITLKVKYADFEQITRSISLDQHIADYDVLSRMGIGLLDKTLAGQKPIRLLGIQMSNLVATE
jgi:DNA polymerase-4